MSSLTSTRAPEQTIDSRSARFPSATWRTWVAENPIKAYFALAFAYSWACWLPAIALGGGAKNGLLFLGVWGPAAAGATATRLRGRSVKAWLRSILRWRVPRRWYAYALVLSVVMVAVASVPFVLLGHDLDSSLLGTRLVSYLPMLVILSLLGGGNEELGWRGFALPALLERHSPARASLVLGSLWTLWHLPLLGAADDLTHGLAGRELTMVLAATLLNIVALTFICTFLFRQTRSALLAVVLHGSFNTANGVLVLRDEIEGAAYSTMQYCITITTVAVAASLYLRTNGRLGPDTDSAVQPTIDLRPGGSRGELPS